MDSNPIHSDLNPWILSYEKQVKAVRIFELWIRISYPKWSWRLKVRLKDLNLWDMDSNPSLAQNSNFTKAIWISYTTIRIPLSAEALNARPATPTTRFSNPISLTIATWSFPIVIKDRQGINTSKNLKTINQQFSKSEINQEHIFSLLESSSAFISYSLSEAL